MTIGTAIRIARGKSRSGFRDSPEKIDAYSSPTSAPKVILLKTLTLNKLSGGTTSAKG